MFEYRYLFKDYYAVYFMSERKEALMRIVVAIVTGIVLLSGEFL